MMRATRDQFERWLAEYAAASDFDFRRWCEGVVDVKLFGLAVEKSYLVDREQFERTHLGDWVWLHGHAGNYYDDDCLLLENEGRRFPSIWCRMPDGENPQRIDPGHLVVVGGEITAVRMCGTKSVPWRIELSKCVVMDLTEQQCNY